MFARNRTQLTRARRTTAGLIAILVVAAFPLSTGAARSKPSGDRQSTAKRLSLNPYGALLSGGASFFLSGFDAPIRLPANGGTPALAIGFTLPHDFTGTDPLTAGTNDLVEGSLLVEILWETQATDCDFLLQTNFLYRARAGQPRDGGSASGDLDPVDATSPFRLNLAPGIVLTAPATPHETAKVRYLITSGSGDFPVLQAGDAVTFGIYREDLPADSCAEDLGIAGISIVYE